MMAPSQGNKPFDDPRIARGMETQLRHRRELLDAGQKPLGWKLAFGGPAAKERLHTIAPLVGFLMDEAVLASGSTIPLAGWTKPAVEPEIAVHFRKNLAGGANRTTVMASIAALGPAIEIADVDHPSDDVEGTLARNIYQRHVVLGRKDMHLAGGALEGFTGRVTRNGAAIAEVTDLQSLTGELIENIRQTTDLLALFNEKIEAGQILIAGSIIPPLCVTPCAEITFHFDPIDTISIRFN